MSCHSRESIVTILETLQTTRRPRLLLRTARIGLADYERERDLRRIMRLPASPAPGPATVCTLLEMEAGQEAQRTRPPVEVGDTWRAARHVEVLIALMAESRLMAEVVVPFGAAPADHAVRPGVPDPVPCAAERRPRLAYMR